MAVVDLLLARQESRIVGKAKGGRLDVWWWFMTQPQGARDEMRELHYTAEFFRPCESPL